jgi:hypothetical protein
MASISEGAQRCRELFHQVCESETTGYIRDRYATFNIWASNIGVFAQRHASLDFRLRELPDEHDLVVQYLALIEESLQQVRLLQPDGHDQKVQRTLRQITDCLNWLRRLSNTIRRAGLQVQNRRANRFPLMDDDGNDISPVFQTIFSRFIKRDYPGLSEELCKRVVSGMLLQRRQILYRRSRQKKLVLQHVPVSLKPLRELEHPKVASSSNKSLPVPEPAQYVTQSQYTATTLHPDQFRRAAAAASSRVSITKTAPLDTRDRALLPPAPKVQDPDADFVCPYCCMLVRGLVASDPGKWAWVNPGSCFKEAKLIDVFQATM